MMIILFAIFGTFVGFVAGFFGIGGGTIVVPFLLLMGQDIKTAVGISVMQMVFSSVFGSYVNYKAKQLALNEGIILGIGGLVGASFSGIVVANISGFYLEVGLCILLGLTIAKFFYKIPVSNEQSILSLKLIFTLFFVGFFVGIISISMGIGGGIFITPILVGFLGYSIKKAVSMGIFFVVFASISGFLSLSLQNLVDYKVGFVVGAGSLVGVYYGVKIGHKTPIKLQKNLLLIFYIIIFSMTVKNVFFN